jgi:hypothetical protein
LEKPPKARKGEALFFKLQRGEETALVVHFDDGGGRRPEKCHKFSTEFREYRKRRRGSDNTPAEYLCLFEIASRRGKQQPSTSEQPVRPVYFYDVERHRWRICKRG